MEKNRTEQEIINAAPRASIIKLMYWIALILLIIDGASYFYLLGNTPNLSYEIIAKKWKMLEDMKEPKDWLILGDSTCNQGISPTILEEELNASAVNLCAIGGMLAVNDSWMLERYIKKFGPPKNVLIAHTYDVWGRESVHLGLASQLPIISLLKERPQPWVFNLEEELSLFFYKYWPIYFQRESLSEAISLFIKNKSAINQSNFDEKGFMSVENARPETVIKEANLKKNSLAKLTFHMSEDNAASLENIKKLAEEYDFDVFIAHGPICNQLFEDAGFKAYFSDIDTYLKNYASKSSRIHYISENYAFSENEMVSSDHVNAKAALKYSEQLSENLKKIIPR